MKKTAGDLKKIGAVMEKEGLQALRKGNATMSKSLKSVESNSGALGETLTRTRAKLGQTMTDLKRQGKKFEQTANKIRE